MADTTQIVFPPADEQETPVPPDDNSGNPSPGAVGHGLQSAANESSASPAGTLSTGYKDFDFLIKAAVHQLSNIEVMLQFFGAQIL